MACLPYRDREGDESSSQRKAAAAEPLTRSILGKPPKKITPTKVCQIVNPPPPPASPRAKMHYATMYSSVPYLPRER